MKPPLHFLSRFFLHSSRFFSTLLFSFLTTFSFFFSLSLLPPSYSPLFSYIPHPQPQLSNYIDEWGQESDMILLTGTFPIPIQSKMYHFPMDFWLPRGYPGVAPLVYCRATGSFSFFFHLFSFFFFFLFGSYPFSLFLFLLFFVSHHFFNRKD